MSRASTNCHTPTLCGNRSAGISAFSPHAANPGATNIHQRLVIASDCATRSDSAPDATIALNGKIRPAKFKPARGKSKAPAPPPGGIACIILVVLAIALVMFFMYLVLKSHANG